VKKLIIGLLLVVISITATLAPAFAQESTKLKKVSVRACWQLNGEFAAILNAMKEGFYAEEGLEVDLRTGGSGIDPLLLVAARSEDFGVVASSGLLAAAVANGKMPVKAIATLMQMTPSGYMYLLKEGEEPGQRTPKDFEGARVGAQPEGWLYVKTLAKMAGLSEDDYKLVPVSWGPEPLLTGQIDYFNGWATNQTWILDQEGKRWGMIFISDYIPFYADLLFARTDFIEQNPDLVRRFVRATMKGLQFAIDNPEKTAANVVELGMPGLTLEQNIWRLRIQNPMCVSEDTKEYGLGHMDLQRWEKVMEVLHEIGELERIPGVEEVMTDIYLP